MSLTTTHLCVPGILPPPGISFHAPTGHVTGIIGPNGAGKSTLLAAINGRRPRSGGSVAIDGHDIAHISAAERARLLALVPQDTSTGGELRVKDMVALARNPYVGRFGRFHPSDHAAVDQALTVTGISQIADRPVQSLSGGQRQLAHLARAIAQRTPVILLDEPVSDLDIRHQLLVMSLLRQLADDGNTVVVVLHDLASTARFCDEVILLHHGTVACQGPPDQVLTEEKLAQFYSVRARVRHDPDVDSVMITPLVPLPLDQNKENSNEDTLPPNSV
ncbi:ATP-binding cassette domain-containing protein [Corynebacterium sp. 3HC-13]|uniref:ABC transporter ATP-binding protein n=1 Tax=Corynebacterium poyangense TaxID=2684405 RepID=UPI001CCA6B20|nr:ABC transporter ATP-binding protein [Corynebacterium poyangense]MBZ8176354.1 ATP-binding cassette domain-containing protein [Corynebacterium poyangense]